jgi:hypothetical protein
VVRSIAALEDIPPIKRQVISAWRELPFTAFEGGEAFRLYEFPTLEKDNFVKREKEGSGGAGKVEAARFPPPVSGGRAK